VPEKRITHLDAIFGQLIVSLRKEENMDQRDLSEKLGINQPALSRLERGESAANVVMIDNLARTFSISVSELMGNFEEAVAKIENESVKIVPKKEIKDKKDDSNVAIALLGAAALALLLSR